MQALFTKLIGPLTCETTGALWDPWEGPDDGELIEIWNLAFWEDYPIEKGNVKSNWFIVAKVMVCVHYAHLLFLTT